MEKWNDNENYNVINATWKTAIDFANKYHTEANQYRIGKNGEKLPYITHIQEVMRILINEANMTSGDVLTVAALHDVLEDTSCTPEKLEKIFGPYITNAVNLLTRKENQPFDEYSREIFTSEDYPWLGNIKLADRIHNLRTYEEVGNIPLLKYKLDETIKHIKPYAEKHSKILAKKLDDEIAKLQDLINTKEQEL